jgi:hypothetical protein
MPRSRTIVDEDAVPYKIFRAAPDHNGDMTVPFTWLQDCYVIEEVLDFDMRDGWHYLVFDHGLPKSLNEFKQAHCP